jgi:predicted transcriptional regulator
MATTSLKLPDDLKEQATKAAAVLGLSPHAFMVEAIRQAAHNAELRRVFIAEATAARKQAIKSGTGYEAKDVHKHLRDRIAGKKKSTLKLKSW